MIKNFLAVSAFFFLLVQKWGGKGEGTLHLKNMNFNPLISDTKESFQSVASNKIMDMYCPPFLIRIFLHHFLSSLL